MGSAVNFDVILFRCFDRTRQREAVKRFTVIAAFLTLTVLSGGRVLDAQEQAPPASRPPATDGSSGSQSTAAIAPAQAIDDTIEAGEAEAKEPARRLVDWNHYEGPFFTIRAGGGLLYDYAAYKQDDQSKQQLDLTPELKLRDVRVLLKGRLKFKRQVTWSSGLMYDGPSGKWLVRETGIMVEIPEIWGHIFVGRTKEGFSLNKVMVGYAGWTMERATISDATIPILADGVKWLGYLPKAHVLWNLGFYGDSLSEGQSFSTYGRQVAGRLAWVHLFSNDSRRLVHVGINGRVGKPKDDVLRLRSRPEAFPAPYFVDTGEFAATATTMTSLEAYYRPRSWLFGTEYFLQKADAPAVGQSLVSRRRCRRHLAGHGRDAHLQHARRILQSGLAGAPGVSGRTWRLGARRTFFVYRP